VHALKNPKAFIVMPNAPMFPKEPVVCESNMTISQNFHMSQVHGARKKMKKRLSSGGHKKLLGAWRWKLTDTEDRQRSHVLGPLKDVAIENCNDGPSFFPGQLRRRFLVCRSMSNSRYNKKERMMQALGRTGQLLRKIEASHSVSPSNLLKPTKARKSSETVLDILFPLSICTSDDSGVSRAHDLAPMDVPVPMVYTAVVQGPQPFVEAFVAETELIRDVATESQLNTIPEADRSGPYEAIRSSVPRDTLLTTIMTNESARIHTQPSLLRCNPYGSRPKGDLTRGLSQSNVTQISAVTLTEMHLRGLLVQDQRETRPLDRRGDREQTATAIAYSTLPTIGRNEERARDACIMSTTATTKLDCAGTFSANTRDTGDAAQQGNGPDPLEADEFRLPSQHDSSSESSDGDDDCDVAGAATSNPDAISNESLFRLPTQSSDEENDDEVNEAIPEKFDEDALGDAFRLPTPQPSSEEDGSDAEEPAGDGSDFFYGEGPPKSLAANNLNVAESNECASVLQVDAGEGLTHETSQISTLQNTQRSAGRVRFSLDSTPQSKVLCKKKNPVKRIQAIEDTPESKAELPFSFCDAVPDGFDHGLSNTQDERGNGMAMSFEDLVCAICLRNCLTEDDPIILCDGPGDGVLCDLAVHVSCYSATLDLDTDKEWRCDRCEFLLDCGQGIQIRCSLCNGGDGALKRLAENEWKHVKCKQKTESRPRLKRLRRQHDNLVAMNEQASPARRPLSDLPSNKEESPEAAAMRKKRRQQVMQQFIDDEADASEDDIEGDREEEDDVLAIEEDEEEFANSFINDSSQLGYTQDELDQADPVDGPEDATHRALDVERERIRQFATPLLNRRVRERRAANSQSLLLSDTPPSAPDSIRGLGNMHFIRSVLEHHRQGGRAEDIEEFYKQLEDDQEKAEPDQETDW
jgi:PHD-finger